MINPKALLLYLTVVSRFAGNTAGTGAYLLLASMHIAIMVAADDRQPTAAAFSRKVSH